jgi:hypothetical protein
MPRPTLIALTMTLCLLAGQASGEPYTADGLTFAEGSDSFEVLGASGTGSREDPFIVHERIFGDGAAILSIGGMTGNAEFAPRNSLFLIKTVINATPYPWNNFEMELREVRSRRSSYEDGLSFGQAIGLERKFAADRFAQAYQNDEPIDAITFYDGLVRPGESVSFRVQITDYSPRWEIFLFQRRESPLALNTATRPTAPRPNVKP